jgi:hypothetical protein
VRGYGFSLVQHPLTRFAEFIIGRRFAPTRWQTDLSPPGRGKLNLPSDRFNQEPSCSRGAMPLSQIAPAQISDSIFKQRRGQASVISRRDARVVQERRPSKKQRAQGKPGARCTRSLACEIGKHTSVVTTGPPERPGLPCAMVLTAYFALSPVIGLVCHRHRRKFTSANLTPASRRQDHTILPSARRRVRLRATASIASRSQRP